MLRRNWSSIQRHDAKTRRMDILRPSSCTFFQRTSLFCPRLHMSDPSEETTTAEVDEQVNVLPTEAEDPNKSLYFYERKVPEVYWLRLCSSFVMINVNCVPWFDPPPPPSLPPTSFFTTSHSRTPLSYSPSFAWRGLPLGPSLGLKIARGARHGGGQLHWRCRCALFSPRIQQPWRLSPPLWNF